MYMYSSLYPGYFSQDIHIDPEKDFPDIHLDVTGSHGQELFPVEKSRGRIYLPEQVLLSEGGSTCLVTGAKEENLVAGSVSGNSFTGGMSPEEIKEQQEAMRGYETQLAKKQLNKQRGVSPQNLRPEESKQHVETRKQFEQEMERNERMEENIPDLSLGVIEEHLQAMDQFEREKAEKERRRGEPSTQNNMGGNHYSHHSASQFSNPAFSGNSAARPSQGGTWEQDYSQPNVDWHQSETYAQPAPAHHVPHIPASAPGDFSQQSSRVDSQGLSANPMQAHNLALYDLELSPSTAEAFLGTLVCRKNDPNTKGVIRWVGSLPAYPGGVIAGIELVSPFVTL